MCIRDSPWSNFPIFLSGQPGYVASPTWLEEVAAGTAEANAPVGSGPFIHEEFNERARSLGVAMDRVDRHFKRRLAFARKRFNPGQQLAVTAALEHVTATLAQWTLENPDLGAGNHSHSPLREMLIWHAMEEIEHKAVAFDVYRSVVGDEKQRIAVARIVFRTFWWEMAQAQVSLLWRDRRIPSWREIREAWQFMWGEGGFRAWSQPELKRYLVEGFHPNDIDQSHLIEQWTDTYPEVAALQVG